MMTSREKYAFSTCDEKSTEKHIFKYSKDGILKTTPCCSMKNRKNNYRSSPLNTCQGEDAVRTKVAELQNKGEKICGICVSTFYADK